MNSPTEWEEAGFKDILTTSGICLIEWPEIAQGTLPDPDIILTLAYDSESSRKVTITAKSAGGQILLNGLNLQN
jgi:tRNA threonylcarbamoyladenosine biosynthesis protein TsaE